MASILPMVERSLLIRVALCALTGLACGLAAPPASQAWLVWVAWTPTFFVLASVRPNWREAALLGWVSGLGIGLVGFSWLGHTLVVFGGFPPALGTVGLCVYAAWMSVPYAAFGIAVARGPRHAALHLLWCVGFFVALTHSWPLVFPYTPLIGLVQTPAWIQLAEVAGVGLVEAHVLIAAWSLARALEQRMRVGSMRPAGAYLALAVALPLGSYALGMLRMHQVELEARAAVRRTTVGLVQPNTPPLFRRTEVAMERLWSASEQAQQAGAEWIVWPEAGPYPYALARPIRGEPRSPEARILARHDVPTLFGAVTYEAGDPLPYNTLVHLAADGRVRETFDKVRLVPFGENIPWIDPRWLVERIPTISHINRGSGPKRFRIEVAQGSQVGVGPLICLEDIIADFAYAVTRVPGGIELFVNATIDAWYGAEKEPWEHLALAQFRSVEHRIPLVRAVSTGVSSVVDATGRLVAFKPARDATPGAEPEHAAEILVHELGLARNTASDPTLYARYGYALVPFCQLTSPLAFVGLLWWRRRQARVAQPRDGAQHDVEL